MAFASLSAQWWDVGTSSGGFQSVPLKFWGLLRLRLQNMGGFFSIFWGDETKS